LEEDADDDVAAGCIGDIASGARAAVLARCAAAASAARVSARCVTTVSPACGFPAEKGLRGEGGGEASSL
jgi:hypothetical protein